MHALLKLASDAHRLRGLVKESMSRWRQPGNLANVARRVLGATPATAGEAKVMSGAAMRGGNVDDAVLHSLGRMPGAGGVMPTQQALQQIRGQQPSMWRRLLEGSGLAQERNYPGFRAQPMPFTGKVVHIGYHDPQKMNLMHMSPQAGGAEKYFGHAQGAIPGQAAIGSFAVPQGTPWFAHGGARMNALGRGGKPLSRHHLDAYEAAVPPTPPLRGFYGSQSPTGNVIDTTNIPGEKLQNWYGSFGQPLAGAGG